MVSHLYTSCAHLPCMCLTTAAIGSQVTSAEAFSSTACHSSAEKNPKKQAAANMAESIIVVAVDSMVQHNAMGFYSACIQPVNSAYRSGSLRLLACILRGLWRWGA